ncbi:unnamed protein product, partial [Amoebophrya sp. A120]
WSKQGWINDREDQRKGMNLLLGLRYINEVLFLVILLTLLLAPTYSVRSVCEPSLQPDQVNDFFIGQDRTTFVYECSDGQTVTFQKDSVTGKVNLPPEDKVKCYLVQTGGWLALFLAVLTFYMLGSATFCLAAMVFLSEYAYADAQTEYEFKEKLHGLITSEDLITRTIEEREGFTRLLDNLYRFLRCFLRFYGVPDKNV